MDPTYDEDTGLAAEGAEDFFALPPELPNLGGGFVEGDEEEGGGGDDAGEQQQQQQQQQQGEGVEDELGGDGAAANGGHTAAAAECEGLEDASEEFEDNGQQQQQQQQQESADEDGGQQQNVQDDRQARRAALLLLAKRTAASTGEDAEAPRKKKHKKDKHAGEGGHRSGGGSSRPKRARPAPALDGGEDGRRRAAAPELPEEAYTQETAEDADFIDDEGVPEDERYIADDEALLAAAEEADEAAPGEESDEGPLPSNPLEEVLAQRKRKKRRADRDEQQLDNDVVNLVSQMLTCAEADAEVKKRNKSAPAMAKLQAMRGVEEMLRQKKYHESFLMQGGLRAMAAWLRPYVNGELPAINVREKLIGLLELMALDSGNDYHKEKIQEADLGSIMMFYSKNPHEKSISLRNRARDLTNAWSVGITYDPNAEQKKRRQAEREHRHRMLQDQKDRAAREARERAEAERRRTAVQGQEGFRARAAVPQPGRLDFVINPGSQLDPLEVAMRRNAASASGSGSRAAKSKSPIGGALGKLLQKQKRGTRDRFGGVSVEGRGMQI